ncbi:MAG: ANTAR domain-containing response regulator [Pseudomonadota bacterium]
MSRQSLRSFRGLHAFVELPSGRDRVVLANQLEMLGLVVTVRDPPAPYPGEEIDIVFFDADIGAMDGDGQGADIARPAIALIGSETPSRLQVMLARGPSAYLMKPIRSTGVYASLAIATHQFAMLQAMRRKLAAAEEKVRSRQLLFSATLHIMKQAQIDEAEAFRRLRRAAMSQRRTIEAVSAEILAGAFPVSRVLAS